MVTEISGFERQRMRGFGSKTRFGADGPSLSLQASGLTLFRCPHRRLRPKTRNTAPQEELSRLRYSAKAQRLAMAAGESLGAITEVYLGARKALKDLVGCLFHS